MKIIAIAAVAAFAVGASAQASHHVGPGGYAEIHEAIAAAAVGDTIWVAPGTYASFTAYQGVTIRSSSSGSFHVAGVVDCPVDETVTFVGFPMRTMQVNGGRAVFENCSMLGFGPGLVANDATVHLINCYVDGSIQLYAWTTPAFEATNCDITAVNTIFSGGHQFAFLAGTGVSLTNCRFHGSSVTATGRNGHFVTVSGPAIHAVNSTVWLSDSTLASTAGGCAVDNVGSQVHLSRTAISGGASCPTIPQRNLLGVDQPGTLTLGSAFSLDYHTDPNEIVIVFASARLGTVNWFPLLEQPSWLDDNLSFTADAAITDASGTASFSWPIPNNPLLIHAQLWFKGVSGFTFPLQASPAAGGTARW